MSVEKGYETKIRDWLHGLPTGQKVTRKDVITAVGCGKSTLWYLSKHDEDFRLLYRVRRDGLVFDGTWGVERKVRAVLYSLRDGCGFGLSWSWIAKKIEATEDVVLAALRGNHELMDLAIRKSRGDKCIAVFTDGVRA